MNYDARSPVSSALDSPPLTRLQPFANVRDSATPPLDQAWSPGPYYAGVGSRLTPPVVCALFSKISARLECLGWTLRSGGAAGADEAFERGITDPVDPGRAEIYVPWDGFRNRAHGMRPSRDAQFAADRIAATVHPIFDRLKPVEKKLHARNVFQVRGATLGGVGNDISFLVCWTMDGAEQEAETNRGTGGTRTAIVLANRLGIPVINFARDGAMLKLKSIVEASPAPAPRHEPEAQPTPDAADCVHAHSHQRPGANPA